jgi:hypothetical protein
VLRISWILAGLFAAFGLSFLLRDSVLISVIILGIIVALIGWRVLKKKIVNDHVKNRYDLVIPGSTAFPSAFSTVAL